MNAVSRTISSAGAFISF